MVSLLIGVAIAISLKSLYEKSNSSSTVK